jgi:hypothetical protein
VRWVTPSVAESTTTELPRGEIPPQDVADPAKPVANVTSVKVIVDARENEGPEHHGECCGRIGLEVREVHKILVGMGDDEPNDEVDDRQDRTEQGSHTRWSTSFGCQSAVPEELASAHSVCSPEVSRTAGSVSPNAARVACPPARHSMGTIRDNNLASQGRWDVGYAVRLICTLVRPVRGLEVS